MRVHFTVARPLAVPRDVAWSRLADLDKMPLYWRGHRRVEPIGREGDLTIVRVTFAFPGPLNGGIARIRVDHQRREVAIEYVEGPIRGLVRNSVGDVEVTSTWDVEASPCLLPLAPWLKRHLYVGALRALERISG